jgi:hypothetical protein
MVKKYLGGTTNIYFIDKENNKINFWGILREFPYFQPF